MSLHVVDSESIEKYWLNQALCCKAEMDEEKVRTLTNWLYELNGHPKLLPERIFICPSPMACQLAVNFIDIKEDGIQGRTKRSARPDFDPILWQGVEKALGGLFDWSKVAEVEQYMRYEPFSYAGLGHDAGWTAQYQIELGKTGTRDEKFEKWCEFLTCGPWDSIFMDRAAFLARRFTLLHRDLRDRLHDPEGPCLQWIDDDEMFFIHGMAVPSWIIKTPELITAKKVLAESNAEIRRVMRDKMGLPKFFQEAHPTILDSDVDGGGQARRLLRIETDNDDPWMVVEVKCPSTGHDYLLRVPPDSTTCAEAVAWTFGKDGPQDYNPLRET